MPHCDPETLALAALGEQLPSAEAEHLASCDQCAAEVAELAELVTLAREAPQSFAPAPDAVWESIRGELGIVPDPAADRRLSAEAAPMPVPIRRVGRAGEPSSSEGSGWDAPGIAREDVTEARPQRRVGSFALAAVAAAVGAILGGTVVWLAVDRNPPGDPAGTIIAQAVLAPLSPAVTEPGKAQVLETPDGLVVRVDATSLPPGSGFHEVWLLDAQATRLVGLGALPSGSVGTFTIPPGVVVTDFPVVDISLEPYDGDPAHSQDSLMRGTLET